MHSEEKRSSSGTVPRWDQTRIVENDLLISKSPCKPILQLICKILVGLILSISVFTVGIINNFFSIFLFHSAQNFPNVTQLNFQGIYFHNSYLKVTSLPTATRHCE